MRVAFVFPPLTSPSYAPLGLASLAGHLRRRDAAAGADFFDANLDAWDQLAARDESMGELRGFLRDRDRFYEERDYSAHRPAWNAAWQRMGEIVEEARLHLDGAGIGEFLDALLDRQAERVLRLDPGRVGISVLYLDQLPWALALARRIGEAAGPEILLGGAALSALDIGELLGACPGIAGAVLGEGEAAAEALCLGLPLERVPSLAHRRDGAVVRNPAAREGECGFGESGRGMPDGGSPGFGAPDFSVLPVDAYWNPSPVLPALFSRGCRWRRCRFCAHNASFGDYECKTPEAFIAELAEYRQRHGARHVYLADQYVGGSDLERLARALLAEGLEIGFHTMMRPDEDATRERLERLRRAGCRWISWGVESGSQRLLGVVRKGTRVPVIERVIRDAHEVGIANLAMMIFGLPTSTDEDLEQTLALIERLADAIDVMTASQFVLFEGTPFAQEAAGFGLHIRGPRELLRVQGRPVHSTRLDHRERAADGSLRPPRAALEASVWERRRAWMKDFTKAERFCVEHSLLWFGRP